MVHDILIADDHPLFQSALREAVSSALPQARIQVVDNFDAIHTCLNDNDDIDLVIMDLKMPGNLGLMGLLDLRKVFPAVAIAICSANENQQMIVNALHYGAIGYIPKSLRLDQIQDAIKTIIQGNSFIPSGIVAEFDTQQDALEKLQLLTPQQLRVLKMVAQGLLNKQIAWELNIKETTIKTHVSDILKKLDITNRTQAALFVQFLEGEN